MSFFALDASVTIAWLLDQAVLKTERELVRLEKADTLAHDFGIWDCTLAAIYQPDLYMRQLLVKRSPILVEPQLF